MCDDKYRESTKKMVNSVLKKLGTNDSFVMKRVFGKTVAEADISTYIAFLNLTGNGSQNNISYHEEADFLLVSLICTNESLRSFGIAKNGTTSFQELLGRLYLDSTKSMKRKICRLITLDITSDGEFTSLFSYIFRVLKSHYDTKDLDYESLLYDLRRWNLNTGNWNSARKSWARTIVHNDISDTENSNTSD